MFNDEFGCAGEDINVFELALEAYAHCLNHVTEAESPEEADRWARVALTVVSSLRLAEEIYG
jgi:hypothetical protein